jgi:hypothetical protein
VGGFGGGLGVGGKSGEEEGKRTHAA